MHSIAGLQPFNDDEPVGGWLVIRRIMWG